MMSGSDVEPVVEQPVSNVNDGKEVVPDSVSLVDATAQVKPEAQSTTASAHKKSKEGRNYSEVSPTKRYIRFDEKYSSTAHVKASFRGFDTKNGIEVVWQKIYLSLLGEAEQESIMRSLNFLKEVQHPHIVEYLSVWVTEEPRTVNLITTYLDPLERFVGKVKTLRWRIVKKWCKQLLIGLNYLHTFSPVIVHRNLNLGNIFMNGGLGEIYLGGMWLSAVLADGSDSVNMSELITTYCYQGRQPGSPAYKAPEVLSGQPITTKVDIYSFGMCLLVLLTREDPYVEIYGAHTLPNFDINAIDPASKNDDITDSARQKGYDSIASLITRGVMPEALERVSTSNPEAGAFLRSCLALNPDDRKSAAELLNDDFLQKSNESGDDSVVIEPANPKRGLLHPIVMDEAHVEGTVEKEISTKRLPVLDNVSVKSVELETADVVSHPIIEEPLKDVSQRLQVGMITPVVSEPLIPPVSMDEKLEAVTNKMSENEIKLAGPRTSLESCNNISSEGEGALTNDTTQEASSSHSDVVLNTVESQMKFTEGNSCETVSSAELPVQPTEKSSLVEELAKLGTSDDVSKDRGIHDGRRSKSEQEVELRNPNDQKASPRKNGRNSETFDSDSNRKDETSGKSNTVVVQLLIEGQYTSDGKNKEVEFTFDDLSDKVEIIAAEMKDELNLELSLEHLIQLIQSNISSKLNLPLDEKNSDKGPDMTGSQSSLDNALATKLPVILVKNETEKKDSGDALSSNIERDSSRDSVKCVSGFDLSDNIVAEISRLNDTDEVKPLVVSRSSSGESGNKDLKTGLSADDSQDIMQRQLSPEKIEELRDDITLQQGIQLNVTPSGNSAPIPSLMPNDNTLTPINTDNKVISSKISPNMPSTSGISITRHELPPPGDNATVEELANYEKYLKDVEAIDKESRAARRAFEQRIQKHKIIQQTCEEDFLKMEADLEIQQAKLCSKQCAAEKKRDDDLTQIKDELFEKLRRLKMRIDKRRDNAKQEKINCFQQDIDGHGVSSNLVESSSSEVANGINMSSQDQTIASSSSETMANAFTKYDKTTSSLNVATSSSTSSSVQSCESPERLAIPSPTSSHHQHQHFMQHQPSSNSAPSVQAAGSMGGVGQDFTYSQDLPYNNSDIVSNGGYTSRSSNITGSYNNGGRSSIGSNSGSNDNGDSSEFTKSPI